jgi:hypothetical protein
MDRQELLKLVEAKFEEVHDLVYDGLVGREPETHPLLVEMWEVFKKLEKLS